MLIYRRSWNLKMSHHFEATETLIFIISITSQLMSLPSYLQSSLSSQTYTRQRHLVILAVLGPSLPIFTCDSQNKTLRHLTMIRRTLCIQLLAPRLTAFTHFLLCPLLQPQMLLLFRNMPRSLLSCRLRTFSPRCLKQTSFSSLCSSLYSHSRSPTESLPQQELLSTQKAFSHHLSRPFFFLKYFRNCSKIFFFRQSTASCIYLSVYGYLLLAFLLLECTLHVDTEFVLVDLVSSILNYSGDMLD